MHKQKKLFLSKLSLITLIFLEKKSKLNMLTPAAGREPTLCRCAAGQIYEWRNMSVCARVHNFLFTVYLCEVVGF